MRKKRIQCVNEVKASFLSAYEISGKKKKISAKKDSSVPRKKRIQCVNEVKANEMRATHEMCA